MRVLGAAAVALSLMISGAGAAGPDTLDQPFSGALKIGNTTITVNGIVAPDQTIGLRVNGIIAPDQSFSLKGIISPDHSFSFRGTTPTGQTFSGSFGN
jgi:hypothetical protein